MEDELKELLGQTIRVRARVGKKSSNGNIILENLIINDTIRSDHQWVKSSRRFINIINGDWIKFTADVVEYDGLDERGNVVKKQGLYRIRNLRRI